MGIYTRSLGGVPEGGAGDKAGKALAWVPS